jgi:hypothetical protein
MSWSLTRTDHVRYFAHFSRGEDASSLTAAAPTPPNSSLGEGTLGMIEKWDELWSIERADVVVPLLERWLQLERTRASAGEKQEFLEPLIRRAQRAPAQARGELVMVLLALEPLCRSATSRQQTNTAAEHSHRTLAADPSSWPRSQSTQATIRWSGRPS